MASTGQILGSAPFVVIELSRAQKSSLLPTAIGQKQVIARYEKPIAIANATTSLSIIATISSGLALIIYPLKTQHYYADAKASVEKQMHFLDARKFTTLFRLEKEERAALNRDLFYINQLIVWPLLCHFLRELSCINDRKRSRTINCFEKSNCHHSCRNYSNGLAPLQSQVMRFQQLLFLLRGHLFLHSQ